MTHYEARQTLNRTTLECSDLVREEDGFQYRDLNQNGRLDVYEDRRQPVEHRVEDLLRRLSLADKAGLALHGWWDSDISGFRAA